jgi:hypothetical protein
LGFFDQAIAAPSMKAALEAWGADSNLFHQGAAKQTEDPDIVAATMDAPGIVLKRPVGSSEPFREHADLPKDLGDSRPPSRPAKVVKGRSRKRPDATAAERKAALAFEKEEKRRQRIQAREEVAREKKRERKQQAIEKAQDALDQARRKHEDRAADIRAEIERLEDRLRDEDAKWERELTRLEAMLRRAHE